MKRSQQTAGAWDGATCTKHPCVSAPQKDAPASMLQRHDNCGISMLFTAPPPTPHSLPYMTPGVLSTAVFTHLHCVPAPLRPQSPLALIKGLVHSVCCRDEPQTSPCPHMPPAAHGRAAARATPGSVSGAATAALGAGRPAGLGCTRRGTARFTYLQMRYCGKEAAGTQLRPGQQCSSRWQ
jgi:hypothetical protein